jgi:hypothetical protein
MDETKNGSCRFFFFPIHYLLSTQKTALPEKPVLASLRRN